MLPRIPYAHPHRFDTPQQQLQVLTFSHMHPKFWLLPDYTKLRLPDPVEILVNQLNVVLEVQLRHDQARLRQRQP